MSTRAIKALTQCRIPFEVVTYEHLEKGARFAASAIGMDLSETVKTLVVELPGQKPVLALLPGDCQLAVKKLAKVLGVKKAQMADVATAERITGYKVGGVGPFGIEPPLAVVMEVKILDHSRIAINGGQRGTMLIMAPADIAAVTHAKVADISPQP